MAIDRPTFDESWYRVAQLKPRLRSVVQVHRQHYRGQRWHVLRDPGNNQSYRLDDAAWHFVCLLDGRRSVAEAWKIANTTLLDHAPTQGEAIQLLGQLYMNNLLHGELSPDAIGMFERLKRRRQREIGSYAMNVLFMRFPLFDPDRIFAALTPVLGWLFGPVGLVLWLGLMLLAAVQLAGQGPLLLDQAQGVLDPGNLVYLYLCFVGIKLIHEFGHGIACRRYGQFEPGQGEVHTLGIMLLVLTPVPYVDASSAWTFRSKAHRVMVGAAGMYVELMVAACAAIVWAHSAEGHLINALAYNLLLIGSVSTIFFNANPLLRFDGYYILSDLLEMPNLNQRSKQYLYYLIRRYAWGVRHPQNPAHNRRERITFVIFALSAFVYRLIICVVILLFIAESLLFVGMVLAVMAVIGWVIVPLVKLGYYLLTSPELERTRVRALALSGATVVLVLGGAGLWPLPHAAYAPGVVQAREQIAIHAQVSGRLVRAMDSSSPVQAGEDVVVVMANEDLGFEQRRLQALLQERLVLYRESMTSNLAQAQAHAAQILAIETSLRRIEEDIAALEVLAPITGQWLTPDVDDRLGALVARGEQLGMVATLDQMLIKVAADQWSGPRLLEQLNADQPIDIRVKRWPEARFEGRVVRVAPAAREELASPTLSVLTAGRGREGISLQGESSQERVLVIDIEVNPSPQGANLLPGQRVMVRFAMARRPLLTQAWLHARQLLQRRWAW